MKDIEVTLQTETHYINNIAYNPQVFIKVYDYYFPRVYNYIYYRCSNEIICDDLTSEVFERALVNIHTFDPKKGKFGTWIFAIARNVVNNHFRLLKVKKYLSIDTLFKNKTIKAHEPNPEHNVINRETNQELIDAINTLDQRERDILGLKFASQMTNRKISKVTGLTESNVGVILYRAIKKLRILLDT